MRDLQILFAVRYSSNDEISKITPGFKDGTKGIYGKNNLVQRVAKFIKTSLGTNFYEPEIGTDIYQLNRIASYSQDEQVIRAVTSQIISQAERQIKSDQDKYTNLDSTELLDKIEMVGLKFVEDDNQWRIRLSIYNQAGQVSRLEL